MPEETVRDLFTFSFCIRKSMYIFEQYSKEHTYQQEKVKEAAHRKFLYDLKSHKQSMNLKAEVMLSLHKRKWK